jgi:sugar lactone lactonase YvrE
MHRRRLIRCLTLFAATLAVAHAADRPEVGFADGRIFPESLTSTKDGTLYIGSMELGSVYRAMPSASTASVWIPPHSHGLQNVLGVLADEASGTLWVCSATLKPGQAPSGETSLNAFALADGAFKKTYPLPGNGLCNDTAVAADGTAYVTDTLGARVLRLKKGAAALEEWVADKALLATADGLALLGDGALYVNAISKGTIVRIPIKGDGSAGPLTPVDLPSLGRPDGMRSVGSRTLVVADGGGRLVEVTVNGAKGDVRILKEGLVGGPVGVTVAGGMAYVVEGQLNLRADPSRDPGKFRVTGVPYQAPR